MIPPPLMLYLDCYGDNGIRLYMMRTSQ